MMPEQQQRILGYFIEEAKDHLNTIEQGLLNLQATIEDPEMINELFRAAHSVKGGAAMLSLNSIQRTSHSLEDYFKVLKETPNIRVDRHLESMFLQVFDGLQALLEELQGPFGLSEDKAQEVISELEPVFEQLEQHVNSLAATAGESPVVAAAPKSAPVIPTPAQRPPTPSEASALKLVFSSDVPGHLREMLTIFKQPDTAASRTALQACCEALKRIGEQFDLHRWCELTTATYHAVGNSEQTYRFLAPVVIKELKKAQEQVLSGRTDHIQISAELEALIPPTVETDAALDEIDAFLDEAFSAEQEEVDLADLFASETIAAEASSDELDALGLPADLAAAPGAVDPDRLLEDAPSVIASNDFGFEAAAAPKEPIVGTAELNSLADLFEGEMSGLATPWEEISESEAAIADTINADVNLVDDFSDLLDSPFENNQSSNPQNDLADLFGEPILDELAATSPPTDGNDLDDLLDLSIVAPSAPDSSTAEQDLDDLLDSFSASDETANEDLLDLSIAAASAPDSNTAEQDLDDLLDGFSGGDEAASEDALFLESESPDASGVEAAFDDLGELLQPEAEDTNAFPQTLLDEELGFDPELDVLADLDLTFEGESPVELSSDEMPTSFPSPEATVSEATLSSQNSFDAIEDPWSSAEEEVDVSAESALDALDELWSESHPAEAGTTYIQEVGNTYIQTDDDAFADFADLGLAEDALGLGAEDAELGLEEELSDLDALALETAPPADDAALDAFAVSPTPFDELALADDDVLASEVGADFDNLFASDVEVPSELDASSTPFDEPALADDDVLTSEAATDADFDNLFASDVEVPSELAELDFAAGLDEFQLSATAAAELGLGDAIAAEASDDFLADLSLADLPASDLEPSEEDALLADLSQPDSPIDEMDALFGSEPADPEAAPLANDDLGANFEEVITFIQEEVITIIQEDSPVGDSPDLEAALFEDAITDDDLGLGNELSESSFAVSFEPTSDVDLADLGLASAAAAPISFEETEEPPLSTDAFDALVGDLADLNLSSPAGDPLEAAEISFEEASDFLLDDTAHEAAEVAANDDFFTTEVDIFATQPQIGLPTPDDLAAEDDLFGIAATSETDTSEDNSAQDAIDDFFATPALTNPFDEAPAAVDTGLETGDPDLSFEATPADLDLADFSLASPPAESESLLDEADLSFEATPADLDLADFSLASPAAESESLLDEVDLAAADADFSDLEASLLDEPDFSELDEPDFSEASMDLFDTPLPAEVTTDILIDEDGLLGEAELSEDSADLFDADLPFEAATDDIAATEPLADDSGLSGLEDLDLDSFTSDEPPMFDLGAVAGEAVGAPDDAGFDDLDQLLADTAATTSAGSVDFDELESLLDEDTAAVEMAAIAPPESSSTDFDDLEALLDNDVATSTEELGNGASDLDEFSDLEKLLEEADQSLGGSSPSMRASSTGRSTRRMGGMVDQTMRVSVKHLDNLNNLVGELVVNRNSLEQDQERLRQFLDNLLFQVQQLNDVGQRMRDLYERSLLESSLLASRQAFQSGGSSRSDSIFGGNGGSSHATGATFDALEMDRFTGFHTLTQEMIELIVRVRESASDIAYTVESTDQIARQFRQVTTQLQEGLNKARMVPFAQTADRLPRAVRDISIKCGKEARLLVEGRDTLIDKMILERLYDPMTHLVNNAITHGIETPDERAAMGKPREGTITVRAFYQGNQTVIYIADDGAGINPDVVKRKAIQKGMITQAEADAMSTLETYELLFRHGFSTRDKADDFAGRGVGMDVVRTALSDIRGSITIDSELGKGTSFTIRLPLTLSISKALSCLNNQARIAFPMDGVEDMFDVPKERIQVDPENHTCIQWRDTLLTFQPLSELLQFNRSLGRGRVYGGSQDEDMVSIVVLRNANTFIGVQVDRVLGEQEIVIKQIEGPVPKPMGIAGATVLGDGRVMPIGDVLELIDIAQGRVRREAGSSLWSHVELPPETPTVEVKAEPTVLIVDDSITVRELLSMSFNKVGYRVEQARDGQEAWEKLRSGLPCDLVFCDIEMPRMDGLELLSRMQKDGMLKRIPIAMLTSRGADRHRQMAVDLGASGYFTKPYLEEALLDAAQRMLNGEVLLIRDEEEGE